MNEYGVGDSHSPEIPAPMIITEGVVMEMVFVLFVEIGRAHV